MGYRRMLFVFHAAVLQPLTWMALAIFRPFRYLFVVYPGTNGDISAYCPLGIAKRSLFRARPAIGGIITKGGLGGWGLVLVVPHSSRDLLRDKDLCALLVRRVHMISRLTGAHCVAAAGQAPSILARHGIRTNGMLDGITGTIYAVEKTLEGVIDIEGLARRCRVAIIGAGFVGSMLHARLDSLGYTVDALDLGSDRSSVSRAHIVVLLTPRGDDAMPYFPFLREDAVIIDDTHPHLRHSPLRTTYRVAMMAPSVRILPHLPGYDATWLPGCVLEAMVVSHFGPETIRDHDTFREHADLLRFVPALPQSYARISSASTPLFVRPGVDGSNMLHP